MKKVILAAVCMAALMLPANAQTADPLANVSVPGRLECTTDAYDRIRNAAQGARADELGDEAIQAAVSDKVAQLLLADQNCDFILPTELTALPAAEEVEVAEATTQ